MQWIGVDQVIHHPGCTADYPEKPRDERPQQITRQMVDGYYVNTCVDCGAFETNLPAEDDPYWDDAKADLKQMEEQQ